MAVVGGSEKVGGSGWEVWYCIPYMWNTCLALFNNSIIVEYIDSASDVFYSSGTHF